MIFAAKNGCCAGAFSDNRESAMSADIVEAVDVPFSVLDEEEGKARYCEREVVSCFFEAA